MLEAALFRHDRIPCNSLDRRLHRIAFEIDNTNSVFVNDGDLAVTQKEDVTRVLQNWRNVGSDKKNPRSPRPTTTGGP